MPQHDLAVLVEMLAEAKRLGRALQQSGQPLLAGDERLGAEVLAVEVEQVEEIVAEAVGAVGQKVGLQGGEVGGAAGPLDDELAVEDRGLGGERGTPLALRHGLRATDRASVHWTLAFSVRGKRSQPARALAEAISRALAQPETGEHAEGRARHPLD